MHVEVSASPEVARVLARLGRTEDVTFSPGGRRLAVAGYAHNSILILDIAIAAAPERKSVALTDCVELSAPGFARPHGVAFIDEDTVVVANREGGVVVLKVPRAQPGARALVVPALDTMQGNRWVSSPGSVSASRIDAGRHALLVCNNYAHYVSRHVLDARDGLAVAHNELLLSKGLNVPDGVAVSRDNRWIAVSSHGTHGVLLYDASRPLDYRSEPSGILDKVNSPHGVRFTPDDEFVIVADAGAPCLHVYARNGGSWTGTREPVASYRVMDDATFLRGRHNPEEGGPKGIDIDPQARVVVTTCESQALTFFDAVEVLAVRASVTHRDPTPAPGVTGVAKAAAGGTRASQRAPSRAAPCPCGSGKRFKHCCGASGRSLANDGVPAFAAVMSRALNAQRARAFDAADRLYRDALHMRPENPDALHMLGVVCYELGRWRESARLIRKAGELAHWQLPGILHNYGLTLGTRMLGRNTGAMAKLRVAYDRWLNERESHTAPKQEPLVSVVLITNDRAADIETSLESVFAQTYGNLELLVVDAGMPGANAAILQGRLESRSIPFRFIGSRAVPVHAAINEAVRQARGSYINPLLPGDRFEPSRIADMVRGVAHRGLEWGFAACVAIDPEGRPASSAAGDVARWIAEIIDHVRSSDTVGAALFARFDPTVSAGNLFFSKALSEQLGGFRPQRATFGWDFALRALRLSEPGFVASVSYGHRLRDAQAGVDTPDRERAEVDAIFSDYCLSVLDDLPPNRFAPGGTPHGLTCLAQGLSVAQGATPSPQVLTRLDDGLMRDDERMKLRADREEGGLNVVGFFMGDFGLGESVRTFAATCRDTGIEASFRDADGVLGARRANRTMDALLTDEMPHRTTLFYMNPDQLVPLKRWHMDRGESMGRRVIGYWYWEIDAFPERWRPALDAVDEIWVASDYVGNVLRRVTDKPVLRIPHAFEASLPRRYSRAEFSLPEEKFLFLFTFDFNSFVERKNPLAAIEAFSRAFPAGDERAALVVKCTQGYRFPQQLDVLLALAAKDPRIVVIDRLFSRDEATGLQSVCDAYVSLHRAEGLGLGMAECVAQGKPVVATGYSGNLDFMRADNSCLVDYTLIPVRPGDYVDYEPGWFWADPDIDQAVRYMVRLVEDPEYRRDIGQRAAADMRRDYNHGTVGAAIRERLDELSRADESRIDQVLAGAIC